jgi:hypothetical protein
MEDFCQRQKLCKVEGDIVERIDKGKIMSFGINKGEVVNEN